MPSTVPYSVHSYVDEWLSTDRSARAAFADGHEQDLSRCLSELQSFCQVYGIGRNFSRLEGGVHLAPVLRELLAVQYQGDRNETYWCLFSRLRALYGKNLWSATSKLLWLRFGSPFRLFDQYAEKWMKAKGCADWGSDELVWYGRYCGLWQREFEAFQPSISNACEQMRDVREFFVTTPEESNALGEVLHETWFHERVFDHFISWPEG